MATLPPGNILQIMYLKRLIKRRSWTTFLEIGSDNGHISQVLLRAGLTGLGCDLNLSACENNHVLNKDYITQKKYEVRQEDFLITAVEQKFDLIISCMVIEHLEQPVLDNFIRRAKAVLQPTGSIVFFVPSSMRYWGIEDEVAGHIKRYEFEDFQVIGDDHDLMINEITGLTYPLSNMLLGISNYLVRKNESDLISKSQKDRTIHTGNRTVPFKTTFPTWMGLFLNEFFLWPFHLLQMTNSSNPRSMVIANEFRLNGFRQSQ